MRKDHRSHGAIYGIFKKGAVYPIILLNSLEEAERVMQGKEQICEIREVIE